ncbi:pentatricopeptide repeat-containing protein At3g29290 isoform X1 [Vigna angularis]|uniref:pentatricopeptide repeat-containing protein At3g29290 isoform X1 n=1 Tax=Phaseolus angularis TaxID=3914 RepID=UPI0022B3F7E6|nr:pentatricopeptide repeat-containing protein At3g29290 isoform X1 [Vigna angularis]
MDMPLLLSFPFQFHTYLLKLSYSPFLSAPIRTKAYVKTRDRYLGIVFLSQPKYSNGSAGFHESPPKPRDLVHAVVDSGLWEQEEERVADIVYERREIVDANSFLSKKELPPWGEVELEDGDDDIEGRGQFDTTIVSKDELCPWGEVELEEQEEEEDDDDDDDIIEVREEFGTSIVSKEGLHPELDDNNGNDKRIEGINSYFVSNKELIPWGVVKDDEEDDGNNNGNDNAERRAHFVANKKLPTTTEADDGDHDFDYNNDDAVERITNGDTYFMAKKELPPWGGAQDDNAVSNNAERRANGDVYIGAKKELAPWGEADDGGHLYSRHVETTLSASERTGLIMEQGAIFLEEMDENVLSNRIVVLSRTNKIRSAMEYFRSMELSGLSPNIHACNSLVSSLFRNGWYDDCLKVFNFTRAKGITTGHTYSLILMAHAKAHGCDSALRFFRELESECDVEKDFDAIVYNTMVSICRNVDNWYEIEKLWKSMKENGCAGTCVTYRLLINSFVRCDQSDLAFYAYREMVQKGFEPDNNILNAIIGVCAKEGKWDAALSVFKTMLKGELKPNLVACNALINSLGRAGELKQAFQIYNTMKSLDLKPDAYTFNALLSSLNKANRHHKALELFEMIERDQTSQFNIHLYNTVLVSCSKLRLWERAIEILWQMEASGLSNLTMSYNLVIRTCELARKSAIALQVYKHMVHQKCSPNLFTYLSVVRCCVRGNLWENLEEILNQNMPNATLYNAAIQGLCLRCNVNLANKVYTKMLESGLQPDVKTQVLMLRMIRKRK